MLYLLPSQVRPQLSSNISVKFPKNITNLAIICVDK